MNANIDCKTFQDELPDLVLEPGRMPSAAAAAHMIACPPCSEEYLSFQSTFAALDRWTVPEPTAYFDQKLAVRLREEQAAPAMGWLERLTTSLSLNTGRGFRPMLAGALSLALLVGGGSVYEFNRPAPPAAAPAEASATVNDLQIFDRNEQAFQTLDMIEQDEQNAQPTPQAQDAPDTVPAS